MKERTFTATTMDEMIALADKQDGFIEAMWCGSEECEETVREKAGLTSRCMPFEQKEVSGECIACGQKADKMVVWGKSY